MSALTPTADRVLGPFTTPPVGLGGMNLSHVYYPLPSPEQAARVLRTALDLGVTHVDTAALYGFGANEELIGRVLAPYRDGIVLASKCGMTGVDGKRVIDGRPEALRATAFAALSRLRTDVIDLYYLHRIDPKVPVEESVGALGDLVTEGVIRSIGLSEVSGATLRRAHAVHPIAAVQNEYSLWSRNPELGILEATADLGVALVAFSPLARGFLTSQPPVVDELPPADLRHHMPRFEGQAYAANLVLRHRLMDLARTADVTLAQLALAWVLSRGPHVHVIPGTRSVDHLSENVAVLTQTIPADVLEEAGRILNADTVTGARYNPTTLAETDADAFPHAG